MPVVPSSIAPSVAPTSNSGIPYQTAAGASPDAFGAGIGEAQQKQGAAVEHLGDVLAQNAEKFQAEINAASAKDLFLRGTVEVGKLEVEYDSLQGSKRFNAYPEYVKNIEKVRADLKAAAPNGQVAKLFDQDFARRVGYSIVDGARSAKTAFRQYENDTNKAVRASTLDRIATYSQDDKRFDTELQIGKESFLASDEYRGSSPEVKAQREREYVSGAWSTRLEAMARTDPLRARELFSKNKEALSGDAQMKLEYGINNGIINVQSRVSADKIIQEVGTGGLEEKIKRFEGYTEKPYSDYKQTSIGYGSKAQPGDENIPPEQRKAVYTQRMRNDLASAAQIVDNFAPGLPKGTRDAMISLTQNAGSTWTQQGLGQALRSGDETKAKELFVQYNRAGGEVHPGLVTRRAEEVSWFGGEKTDQEHMTLLQKATNKASEEAARLFPDDPGNQARYLDTLQQRIRTDYNVMQSSAREIVLQNKNAVFSEVLDPTKHITSYEQLSPQAKAAFDAAPPQMQESFRTAMRKVATADVPMTNERQSRYDSLYGMSRNEPDKFMALNVDNEDLPRGSKSSLLKMQADRKALIAKGEKLGTVMHQIQPDLNALGIVQSRTDPAKQEEYNRVSGVMAAAVQEFENDKKRPPNDAEVREIGKQVTRQIVLDPGIPYVPFTGTTKRAFEFELRKGSEAEDYAKIPVGEWYRHPSGQVVRKRQQ